MLYTLALAFLLPFAYAQDVNTSTVLSELANAKVIPDVIPTGFTPRLALEVVFMANGSTFAVKAGANLTKAQTINMPSFALLSNNSLIIGKPYLMAIVDPDAPTPQNNNISEFRHFLGADYIADNNTNGEFIMTNHSKTATLTDYTPPDPPAGSAPHRYVVLCYLQNSTGVTPPAGFNATNRQKFNITEFVDSVKENNMTLIAATFFYVSPNATTGSVLPNTTSNGVPVASGTAPAKASPASDAIKLGVVVAWTFFGVFTASAALLL